MAIKVLYSKFIQVEAAAKRHGKDAFVEAYTNSHPTKIKGFFELTYGVVFPFIVVVFSSTKFTQRCKCEDEFIFRIDNVAHQNLVNYSFVEVEGGDAIEII